MPNSVERIAQEVETLRRRVNSALRTPQMGSSSIDDGSIKLKTGGILSGYVGTQYDGTTGAFTINGPIPPIPSLLTMTTVMGGVLVEWDGKFPDQPYFSVPVVAPMDWLRLQVEVSPDPDFITNVQRGSIMSAAGGHITIAWPITGTPLYARAFSRTTSGKFSEPSLVTGPVNSGLVGLTDLGFNIAQYAGGTTVYFGTATPVAPTWGFTIGDLWHKQIGTSTGGIGQPPSGTPLYEERRWDGDSWELTAAQGTSAAMTQALLATQDAASKLKVFNQDTAPTYVGAANTAAWYETDQGNKPWIWDGSVWVARTLGNGAITPNSLIASNVIATGTISAALFEALMVLASVIIAGDPAGTHARMSASGFQVFSESPIVGAPPYIVSSQGNPATTDRLGVSNEAGDLLFNVDENGIITAADAYFNADPTIMGRKLISDWMLDDGPRGLVARAQGFPNQNGIVAETQLFGCTWAPTPGRHYRITVSGLRFLNSGGYGTGQGASFMLRHYTDVQGPIFATLEASGEVGWRSGLTFVVELPNGSLPSVPTNTVLSALAAGSSIHCAYSNDNPYTMVIEDIGAAKPDAGATYASISPIAARQQRIWENPASWAMGYKGDSTQMTDAAGHLYQGYTDVAHGNQKSLIGFPDATSFLSGAYSVDKVEVYLYNAHWYDSTGGTTILGTHGLTAIPTTFTGTTALGQSSAWPRAAGRWVNITSWGTTNWVNGTWKGIALGPGTTTATIYNGRFNGPTEPNAPRLRITYTK